MAPYATIEDLASRWTIPANVEGGTVDTLLADASVWLRSWFPNLDGLVEHGVIDPSAPVMVSCSMVKRAILNADTEGARSEQRSQTAGVYTDSTNRVFSNPEGNLYITAEERNLLQGQPATAASVMARGL
ncbi:hypothetical protein [Williamsia serinedens]|uniref:hypothetical protein n=1 Tax=Williamsia serinedens TaxID=391736 RepID=UPI002FEDDF57